MKYLPIFCILLVITSCGKEPDPTENYTYNAFFVFPKPSEQKVYVGTVTGLSSCKYVVSDYYTKRRKFIKGKWDYICCLHTDKGECVEQHRYEDR
jgi:hypothetical protein